MRPRVRRVRDALGPALWVAFATGLSYYLAHLLFGHNYPFFAATAAFSALGFTADLQPRRVAEVALGVSLGVGFGEAVQVWLGAGPLQVAGVVMVALLIARFIDPSPVFTMQCVVQSVVVLGLPPMSAASTNTIMGRWSEALLGGAVALGVSLFMPRDPRRRPRRFAQETMERVSDSLGILGEAIRRGDHDRANEALGRGRQTQALLARWEEAVRAASAQAKVSPAWHHKIADLTYLGESLEYTDTAIRNIRPLARRTAAAVNEGFRDERTGVLVSELGDATSALASAIGTGSDPRAVLPALATVAGQLDTRHELDPVRHTLLALLRSATFDLMLAAGATRSEALAAMP